MDKTISRYYLYFNNNENIQYMLFNKINRCKSDNYTFNRNNNNKKTKIKEWDSEELTLLRKQTEVFFL